MVLRTALIVLRMHTQCKSELPDELRKINLTDEIEDRKIETLCFSRTMPDRQSCLDDKALTKCARSRRQFQENSDGQNLATKSFPVQKLRMFRSRHFYSMFDFINRFTSIRINISLRSKVYSLR